MDRSGVLLLGRAALSGATLTNCPGYVREWIIEAPKDQVEAAVELLRRLGRELEVVESFCVGRDFGGEFTIGALYALKDIKAYETYMNAPLHLQIDRAGLPIVSNMISQDLTDDEDPAIGDKIAEIHRARYAKHANVAALIGQSRFLRGQRCPEDEPDLGLDHIGNAAQEAPQAFADAIIEVDRF